MKQDLHTKRMIFIFLDGVGIGQETDANPFFIAKTPYLPFHEGALKLPDNTPVAKIDPLLGVPGIPQSASGQTSLYTGENIPRLLGQHKDSYPNKAMRQIIIEKNLLSSLKAKNFNAVFINAYPVYSHFFKPPHIQISPTGEFHFSEEFPPLFRRRISATTCMMIAAGQHPFNENDIRTEKAIFQEFTNKMLIEKGLPVPEFSPEKAADILFEASRRHDFILFEYFRTDMTGHRGSFAEQVQIVQDLDRLLARLLTRLNPHTDTLLLTSDHGNLEDASTRGHTQNSVPLIAWGKNSSGLREQIQDLTNVTPAILNFFEQEIPPI